jgi:choline-glycine betaine transporter
MSSRRCLEIVAITVTVGGIATSLKLSLVKLGNLSR